jgi:hypothetical protein
LINSLKRTHLWSIKNNDIEYIIPCTENVIHNLRGEAATWQYDTFREAFVFYNDKNGRPEPTKLEIQTEFNRLSKIFLYFEYSRNRQEEYGSISTQLGLLFNDIKLGKFGETAKTGDFYTNILSIKEKYPKPNGEKENFDISNSTWPEGKLNSDGTLKN